MFFNRQEKEDRSEKEKTSGSRVTVVWFLLLHVCLLLNSMTGVSSKLAGQSQTMSLRFFFFYGMSLLLCLVFAVLWQQVLRHMSLTFAFLNKPVTVIYSLVWSSLLFHEKITLRMMVGAAVILAGIMIGVSGKEKDG